MAKIGLIALAMCCLLVAAHAQTANFNCDDGRRIGNPNNNQCGALCAEVSCRRPAAASKCSAVEQPAAAAVATAATAAAAAAVISPQAYQAQQQGSVAMPNTSFHSPVP
jgi:hypothetical protein